MRLLTSKISQISFACITLAVELGIVLGQTIVKALEDTRDLRLAIAELMLGDLSAIPTGMVVPTAPAGADGDDTTWAGNVSPPLQYICAPSLRHQWGSMVLYGGPSRQQ